nr:MAG TPA: hypothetical protein [Caudoviricetes sp.]
MSDGSKWNEILYRLRCECQGLEPYRLPIR